MAALLLAAVGGPRGQAGVALAADHLVAVVLCRQGLERRLDDAPAQTQHEVQRRLFLDVVVGKRAAVLELLAGKDEALLVGGDALLVLDLLLDVVDGVARLNLQSDGLARERLDENLHGKKTPTTPISIAKMDEIPKIPKIANYRLTSQLGAGSHGVVYGATAPDGARVAIKVFSRSRLRKQRNQRLVARLAARNHVACEAAILAALAHPHIVSLLNVIDDPRCDEIYLVFELCDRPLMLLIDGRAQPLAPNECRTYFCQLLLAVEYLHDKGIAHRDIKPDNMLLSRTGLKLVDFGVSEIFTSPSYSLDAAAGTPAFYAPCLCGLAPHALSAPLCDIWAMGCTLYCMATGTLPFLADTMALLFQKIQHVEYAFLT